jgi:DNA-binding NarL/FixJ family response regulator
MSQPDPLPRVATSVHCGFLLRFGVVCAMSQYQRDAERPITVLLADDHPLLRQALKSVLEKEHDIEVVGEAADGEEAVRVALALVPRVAILDISMPKLSGFEAAQAIKSGRPEVAILILTVHEDGEHIRRMLEVGVGGYLTKDALGDQVVQAVRAVASGDITMSPSVLSSVVKGSVQGSATTPGGSTPLTERELTILRLTARGLTNIQMAAECGFSPRTVRGHLGSIFAKLCVTNRTEAVAAALHLGIISVSDLSRDRRDVVAE